MEKWQQGFAPDQGHVSPSLKGQWKGGRGTQGQEARGCVAEFLISTGLFLVRLDRPKREAEVSSLSTGRKQHVPVLQRGRQGPFQASDVNMPL